MEWKHKYEKLLQDSVKFKKNLLIVVRDLDSRIHLLEGVSDTLDSVYAKINHNHDETYSNITHKHEDMITSIPFTVSDTKGTISLEIDENVSEDSITILNYDEYFEVIKVENNMVHLEYEIPSALTDKTFTLIFKLDDNVVDGEHLTLTLPDVEDGNNLRIIATVTDEEGQLVDDGTVSFNIVPIRLSE